MDTNENQAVEIPADTVSVKISALNQEQLEQVFNMLARQQEAAVAEGQALGRAVDELKAKKAETARRIDKLGSDKELIAQLMTPSLRKDALKLLGADSATVGELLAEQGRRDAVVQGVLLEASARGA